MMLIFKQLHFPQILFCLILNERTVYNMRYCVRTQIRDNLFSAKRLQEVKNLTLYLGIHSNFRLTIFFSPICIYVPPHEWNLCTAVRNPGF